ncbi:MAG: hypothetical protein IT198_10905 [Acidimicrobiia bacterium]|nr:hypothetical protein [Acidimicrobiia bacterium]
MHNDTGERRSRGSRPRRLLGAVGLAGVMLASLLVGTADGIPATAATTTTPGPLWPTGDWLATLNFYRAQAGLAPVGNSASRSAGAAAHAKYQVLNNAISESEDPAKPGYSAAGNAAAAVGNLAIGDARAALPAATDVESLFTAPQSAVSMLETDLESVGYGAFTDASRTGYQWSSVLDVGGYTGDYAEADYPVMFPGEGAVVPLTRLDASEQPNALESCPPSYSATKDGDGFPIVGAPIVVVWSPTADPEVTGSTLTKRGEGALEHCLVDVDSYVFLVPKSPLVPSKTYDVTVTVDGHDIAWSFSVSQRPPYWTGWDIVRGVGGGEGYSGYILDGWGGIHPYGVSPTLSGGPYWKGWDIARGVTVKGTKGYVLDGWGGLHKLGGAAAATGGPYWRNWDIARGVDAKSNLAGGVVVDGWGGLHAFGNTSGLSFAGAPYWTGWDIVRDVALNPAGSGGWTLDGWGGIHAWGGAPQVKGGPYWKGWDIAQGLKVDTDGKNGFVVDGWGGLHPFKIG